MTMPYPADSQNPTFDFECQNSTMSVDLCGSKPETKLGKDISISGLHSIYTKLPFWYVPSQPPFILVNKDQETRWTGLMQHPNISLIFLPKHVCILSWEEEFVLYHKLTLNTPFSTAANNNYFYIYDFFIFVKNNV